MNKLQQLRDKRATLAAQLRAMVDEHTGPAWNDDCESKYNAMCDEIAKLDAEIGRHVKALEIDAARDTAIDRRADQNGQSRSAASADAEFELNTFVAWLRGGMQGLNDEQRAFATKRLSQIQAAQSVGTPAGGGYLVPQEFMQQIEAALKLFGGMRSVATVITTDSGADMPFPTANDTAQAGAILAENTQLTGQDVTFGSVTLKSYMYTSKLILVSLQLIQDSAFDVGSFLALRIAERLGRAQNAHYTTGTGSSQPNGVITAATLGKTGTTGQTATVIYDDLVDLFHSVDPVYRLAAKWMMNDASLKVVRKLKDSAGNPIYLPGYETRGIAAGFDDTLLGKPVVTNQDMATMAANAKSIAFGDFSKYYIRDTSGVQVLQLRERYADYLQVGFFGFQRTDGNLIDAGTNPIKYYANSAT